MPGLKPREFLMIPGPTPVPDAVLEAVGRHPIGHRSADFSKALREATDGLKWLGKTQNDVFILTASGTGAMEAAISNTISSGDRVLSLICGVFGERWAKIAEAFGAQVERLVVDPGKSISIAAVKEKLSSGKFKAVTITHNETSTGVLNDLPKIVSLVREHGALSIVDAVTSFGAMDIPIDDWNIDILCTGSQKALMLPPGLGIIFVGKKAWEASTACKTPRFYFDLAKCKKSLDADTTPFTPNVSLVIGLQASIKLMRDEGQEAIFARHLRLKSALRAGLKSLGLELFVAEDCASPTITSILPPSGLTVDAIRKGLKERFSIVVADGQDALKGKIFRIGHMGYVFDRDILMTLSALEVVLSDLGHKCKTGAAASAAGAVLSASR
jgi:aspartate aminotransferase-like enzyme